MKNLLLIFAALVATLGCARVTETPHSNPTAIGRATDAQNEAAFQQHWSGVEDSIRRTYQANLQQVK